MGHKQQRNQESGTNKQIDVESEQELVKNKRMILWVELLGWPKSLFGFFHKMVRKNPNKLLAYPIDIPPKVMFGLPGGSDGRGSVYNAGDLSSILGLGRSPEERHGNPLQYSCLESSMDREAWQAIVHGVAKSWTRLSD